MKDLNIAFVNYMMKDDLVDAIDSVLADIEDCNYDVQISVADNSQNEDDIKDVLEEEYPEVKYVDTGGNIGFGRANNQAFKETEARYYFALNCDTVIPEGSNTIERIIDYMDENEDIGCIGPKLVDMNGDLQYSCYRYDLSSILIKPLRNAGLENKWSWVKKYADKLLMKDYNHQQARPVDWVQGAAMVIRKEAGEEVGFFDDRYFMYMEDADLCHKLWEADWPVYYVPEIKIKHQHQRDSSKTSGIIKEILTNKIARIHLSSWLKYIWKWRFNHK